jgi:hypothetical protein
MEKNIYYKIASNIATVFMNNHKVNNISIYESIKSDLRAELSSILFKVFSATVVTGALIYLIVQLADISKSIVIKYQSGDIFMLIGLTVIAISLTGALYYIFRDRNRAAFLRKKTNDTELQEGNFKLLLVQFADGFMIGYSAQKLTKINARTKIVDNNLPVANTFH